MLIATVLLVLASEAYSAAWSAERQCGAARRFIELAAAYPNYLQAASSALPPGVTHGTSPLNTQPPSTSSRPSGATGVPGGPGAGAGAGGGAGGAPSGAGGGLPGGGVGGGPLSGGATGGPGGLPSGPHLPGGPLPSGVQGGPQPAQNQATSSSSLTSTPSSSASGSPRGDDMYGYARTATAGVWAGVAVGVFLLLVAAVFAAVVITRHCTLKKIQPEVPQTTRHVRLDEVQPDLQPDFQPEVPTKLQRAATRKLRSGAASCRSVAPLPVLSVAPADGGGLTPGKESPPLVSPSSTV